MEQREGQRGAQTGLPTCTVVVPTRDRLPHLEHALEAVAQQDHKPSEVVVVDSAPTLAGAQDIASRWGARYLLEPLPGASRARNAGAAQSQSEIVVFLDDDALPEPDWLRYLLVEFSQPEVGVVTGCVHPWPKGSAAGVEAAVVRGAGADGRFGGEERFEVDRKSPGWFELCAFGGFGIAANMAVRSSAFRRVGGFDLLLGPGAPLLLSEEYYLYFALIRLGYRGVYTPRSVVSHPYLALEEDRGRRYLVSRTAGSAFMAFLLARHTEHALAILRYIVRRLSGQPSNWGRPGFLPRPPGVSRWHAFKAILAGAVLYLRHRSSRPRFEICWEAGYDEPAPRP